MKLTAFPCPDCFSPMFEAESTPDQKAAGKDFQVLYCRRCNKVWDVKLVDEEWDHCYMQSN